MRATPTVLLPLLLIHRLMVLCCAHLAGPCMLLRCQQPFSNKQKRVVVVQVQVQVLLLLLGRIPRQLLWSSHH